MKMEQEQEVKEKKEKKLNMFGFDDSIDYEKIGQDIMDYVS